MKSWVGTNELVYYISYLRGARRVTFSIHGTDYGALPSFPYYNIATPHLERIYYPPTREDFRQQNLMFVTLFFSFIGSLQPLQKVKIVRPYITLHTFAVAVRNC
jgi:hypothetical protein